METERDIQLIRERVEQHDKRINYLSALIQGLLGNEYIEHCMFKVSQENKDKHFENLSEIFKS